MILTLPTHIILPRKTKKDKVIGLSANWYRNAHFQVSNQAKILYKSIVEKQMIGKEIIPPINLTYQMYWGTKRRVDSSNYYFVCEKFLLDSLVQLGYIPDDTDEYIKERLSLPLIYDKGNSRIEVKIGS